MDILKPAAREYIISKLLTSSVARKSAQKFPTITEEKEESHDKKKSNNGKRLIKKKTPQPPKKSGKQALTRSSGSTQPSKFTPNLVQSENVHLNKEKAFAKPEAVNASVELSSKQLSAVKKGISDSLRGIIKEAKAAVLKSKKKGSNSSQTVKTVTKKGLSKSLLENPAKKNPKKGKEGTIPKKPQAEDCACTNQCGCHESDKKKTLGTKEGCVGCSPTSKIALDPTSLVVLEKFVKKSSVDKAGKKKNGANPKQGERKEVCGQKEKGYFSGDCEEKGGKLERLNSKDKSSLVSDWLYNVERVQV